jgi:O-methyltransferase
MMKSLVQKLLGKAGYRLAPLQSNPSPPPPTGAPALDAVAHADLTHDPAFLRAWEACRAATLTSPERLHALHSAMRHVISRRLPGDIVECGVWRGGSMMLCARALAEAGDTSRELYLYDTYSGMSEPTDRDRDFAGTPADVLLSGQQAELFKCEAPLDLVRRNLQTTKYPENRIHFVQGKVEDTIPGVIPERIALLRLDTDWYESTRHELVHLYPRLVEGGVLIIDDYGHWQGPREAVDEYLAALENPPMLHRIDYSGRIAVKPFTPRPA